MISNTIPLVSIIVPGYNHAPFLKKRIEGILSQTYSNFEVILLDDCSVDGSAEIMLSYEGRERVSLVHINDKNTGNTFKQWEKGISLANGEYIWIAESDDDASPYFLSEMMGILLRTPDAALAFCHSQMIDINGKQLDFSWDEPKRYEDNGVYDGKNFCLHRMVYKNLLYNASMIVFRKDLFNNITNVYQKYKHSGDWLFWFEMCMQGRVCEIPKELNFFRQHPQKVSNEALESKDLAEIVEIQGFIASRLQLSPYQCRCLRGRQSKRLAKSYYEDKDSLRLKYPDIYDASFIDYMAYNIDKIFNFSGMYR